MTELMQTLLEAVIPMLLTGLGGACGWLWKSHRKEEDRDKAIEAGLRTLLRAELREYHHRFCDLHEPLTVDLAEEVERVYIAYHDLGGNGTGTKLYEEIMALPTIS